MTRIPTQLLAECLRTAADGCYEQAEDLSIEVGPEFLKELRALMTLNDELIVVSTLIDELEAGGNL